MEIERKYLVNQLPPNLSSYPCLHLEQAYLCTDPVIRIRREDSSFYLTYKGIGLMVREEYNLPLNEQAYRHLLPKADGRVIAKLRYRIPLSDGPECLVAELDIFQGELAPLVLVEVEFPSEEAALSFTPPSWFGEDVTFTSAYHNSTLSRR